MIEVTRETWHCDKGISKKVYRLKEDKEMQLMKNGEVYAKQVSEFQTIEKDWNCDNDVYELFGAYFEIDGYKEFFTPENIVSMLVDEDLKIVYNK